MDSKHDRTESLDLGPSVSNPNAYFIVSRFSYFHDQNSLLRFVPGSKKPELVLEGDKKDTPPGILVNRDPKSIYRLTGDYFGRGFTGSSSRHLQDIEVFQVNAKGDAKKIGDTPVEMRNIHRGYHRTVESVDPSTIAVFDSRS